MSRIAGARLTAVFAVGLVTWSALSGEPDWRLLQQLEQEGRYEEAMSRCVAARASESSTRLDMRMGVLDYKLGRLNNAVVPLEKAMDDDPVSSWAAEGLYYLTRVCTQVDCRETAVRSVERLRAFHPGSAWTARAELALHGDQGGQPDKGRPGDEDAADALYQEALQLAREGFYQQALGLLRHAADTYPTTRTALNVHLSIANVCSHLEDRPAAIQSLEYVLQATTSASPSARIVCLARDRLARLYRLAHRKLEAVEQFDILAAHSTVPSEKATAMLGGAASFMESLTTTVAHGTRVEPSQWDALRQRCRGVLRTDGAEGESLARAELMIVESLHWQRQVSELLKAAQAFLARWDGDEYPQEVATAHLMAGEALQVTGDPAAALVHYRWVTTRYGTQEIWPRLDLTKRTHFRVVDVLTLTHASQADVDQASTIVLQTWPDSRYADLVRALRSARGFGNTDSQSSMTH